MASRAVRLQAAGAIFALCAALLPPLAGAAVPCQTAGADGAYEARIERDPQGSIQALRTMLKAAPGAGQPSAAHLYAMLADAYWITGDLDQERVALANGEAALVAGDGAQLRRRLQLTELLVRALLEGVPAQLTAFEEATATLEAGSPDIACVLIDRGFLREQVGHYGDAYADLSQAYRVAGERGSANNRMLAADLLSNLYKVTGFPEEALQYADEVIARADRLGARNWLAEGYLRRGDASQLIKDYAASEASYSRALALWKEVGFDADVEGAQQRLCVARAKWPDRTDALDTCREAYRLAQAVDDPVMAKAILGSFGEIELRNGHAAEALGYFDRSLATSGLPLPPSVDAENHRLRGEARAQLGDFAGSFQDLSRFIAWLERSDLLVRDMSRIVVTRAKSEAAIEELQLQRARDSAKSAARDATRLLLERSFLMLALLMFLAMTVLMMWAQRRRQDIERAARATEDRMSTMSRVVGGIAHDFNNQLTVMMQASGLLAQHPAITADPATQDLLQAIRQSGVACANVTAQMLSFSRQQHLQPTPVELGTFLMALRPVLEHLLGTAHQLRYEIEEPEAVAWVDRRQLEAALLNLVSNARDAAPEGGEVLIRAGTAGGNLVRIAVIDRGAGMTATVLARATEPFYSTKPVGGGSGLGLSMVLGFATQSGGSLQLSSEPGRGTSAEILLPAAAASPDAPQPSVSAPRSS